MHVAQLQLEIALGELAPEARRVLSLLVHTARDHQGCDHLAESLGKTSRFGLARLLRRTGLPSYRSLLGWVQVLIWVVDWEDREVSLSTQAFQAGRYPGALYRTVRRVTGLEWTEVQARGSLWVLLELIARCRAGIRCGIRGTAMNRAAS